MNSNIIDLLIWNKEFEEKIYQLKKPFWWMDKSQLKELEHGDLENHEYEGNTVAQLAGTVSIKEREFSTRLNEPFDSLAKLVGFSETPWYKWLEIITYIYLFLTLLINILRPDFHNLTIGVAAFYYLEWPQYIKRWSFRVITFWLLAAIIFWYCMANFKNQRLVDKCTLWWRYGDRFKKVHYRCHYDFVDIQSICILSLLESRSWL